MTRKEAIEALKVVTFDRGDVEAQHAIADDVLCEFLKSLGYDDVVKAWEKVPKWYA